MSTVTSLVLASVKHGDERRALFAYNARLTHVQASGRVLLQIASTSEAHHE